MPGIGFDDLRTSQFWVAVIAEFLGTCFLVLVACGSCDSSSGDFVQISLCFGLSVATIVWAIAHVSGGHINPAISFSFMVTRKISVFRS